MIAAAHRTAYRAVGLILSAACIAWTQEPPKLRLAEVQSVEPLSYKLDLNLDPSKRVFNGTIHIELQIDKSLRTLWLNTSDLSLTSIKLQAAESASTGTPVNGGDNFTGLRFPSEIPPGHAALTVEYTGKFKFGQPSGIFGAQDNGNQYLMTQFESIDARSAFPCFDEPSYKVPWQLTLHVPAADSAISNTPVEKETTAGETKTVIFEQTKPLPSYLVAFGVGPFEYVDAGTAGQNHVPVRIVTPKGRASEARYAAEVTATILTRLEAYFGIPYPYNKADQAAMPISVGLAMENPGMVTYGANILLAKPQSDTLSRQRGYAETAAHELAHQWFGDLVTTAWWNDIWLNEAFATWMEEKIVAEWKPEWHTRAGDVVSNAFAERDDSFPSARSIRQPIASMAEIDTAFDGITYEKGATVIGMFENWIGTPTFQKGVRAYLNAHAFRTATTADFLDAISEASGKDVRSAFATFTNQPGIPVIKISLRCGSGSPPTLTLRQDRFSLIPLPNADNARWSIPVCTRYGSGSDSQTQCTLLSEKSAAMSLQAGSWPTGSCPSWIQANANASGYYRVSYSPDLLSKLTEGDVPQRLTPAERVNLIYDTDLAAKANLLPYGDALTLAARFRDDSVSSVLLGVLDVATSPSANLVPPGLAVGYERFLANTFVPRARAIGWTAKPGESEDNTIIRRPLLVTAATLAGDKELAAEGRQIAARWLAGEHTVSSDILGAALTTTAFYGDVSTARELIAAAKKTNDLQERQRIFSALGSFRDEGALKAVLTASIDGDIPTSDAIRVLLGGSTEAQRHIKFNFLQAHYSEIVKGMFPLSRYALPQIGNLFCDAESKQQLRVFFDSKLKETPELRRTVEQVSQQIDSCIATKQFQEPRIAEFLKAQQ